MKKKETKSSQKLFMRYWLLILALIVGSFLRFYQLDELPGEMFGDINANYSDIDSIVHGNFVVFSPANTGREPMYFYLTALLSYLLGLSYLTMKTTAALIGIVTIVATYFFAKEFFGHKIGLYSSLLIASSKWHIIFSRLGFRAILAPLFVELVFIFFLKAIKTDRLRDYLLTGLFLGLGMYTYTAFRIVPAYIFLLLLAYYFYSRKILSKLVGFFVSAIAGRKPPVSGLVVEAPSRRSRSSMAMKREALGLRVGGLFIVFFLVFAPLGFYIVKNPESYWGHVRKKIAQEEVKKDINRKENLLTNVRSQVGMFHSRGDIVFRVNPTNQPQVDFITSILILVGVLALLFKHDKKKSALIFTSSFILMLPSILSINYPIDVPSATRSMAVVPFVFLVPALGLLLLEESIEKHNKYFSKYIVFMTVVMIVLLNYKNVFFDYRLGLPNNNVAFGRIIANYIDQLPNSEKVAMVSCCWGDWGQPELQGVVNSLSIKREITEIDREDLCVNSKNTLITFVLPPNDLALKEGLKECYPEGAEEILYSKGYSIARIFTTK